MKFPEYLISGGAHDVHLFSLGLVHVEQLGSHWTHSSAPNNPKSPPTSQNSPDAQSASVSHPTQSPLSARWYLMDALGQVTRKGRCPDRVSKT